MNSQRRHSTIMAELCAGAMRGMPPHGTCKEFNEYIHVDREFMGTEGMRMDVMPCKLWAVDDDDDDDDDEDGCGQITDLWVAHSFIHYRNDYVQSPA